MMSVCPESIVAWQSVLILFAAGPHASIPRFLEGFSSCFCVDSTYFLAACIDSTYFLEVCRFSFALLFASFILILVVSCSVLACLIS